MQSSFWNHCKNGLLILVAVLAGAGWAWVIHIRNLANSPTEVVKRHFVFYPEYSHGTWQENPCADAGAGKCNEVTYTIPVKGCGPVTFDWRVFAADEDGEPTWSYNGTRPSFDESQYPLYAILNQDSHLIDSPALGKPLPTSCPLK
jgi:hypothetical protein